MVVCHDLCGYNLQAHAFVSIQSIKSLYSFNFFFVKFNVWFDLE